MRLPEGNDVMIKFFQIIAVFILYTKVAYTQENKSIKILYPTSGIAKTGKWEKIEIGVSIPSEINLKIQNFIDNRNVAEKINPFNPDEFSIEADFQIISIGDEKLPSRKIYGFYYREYERNIESQNKDEGVWQLSKNEFPYRIRFAPNKIGSWNCRVKLVVNGSQKFDLGEIKFECIASSSEGKIQLTEEIDLRHRYLQFSDSKKMFFPVGLNLVWSRLDELKLSDYTVYLGWLNQLQSVGANYIQLSSLPFTHGIEQDYLNNYSNRMNNAWEFDKLLNYTEEKGIYINLLTLIHDEFITGPGWIHKNNHWTNNPYNSNKNGSMTKAINPEDFFVDEVCKNNFKKRLRYILSRWGYSNNLPIIELLSEVDNAVKNYATNASVRSQFIEWFKEMKNFIQKDLGYTDKLVSVSFTQNNQADDISGGVFPFTDVILLHFYGRDKYTNFKNRYVENIKEFKQNSFTKNKPIIFDEMGANVFPTLDKCSDITFHNSLWATALMGCFGTGQNWWWDNAILQNGFEKNIVGIKNFISNENLTMKEFYGEAFADNGNRFKKKTSFENYFLVSIDREKVIGWLHSTSFYWANQKNSNSKIAKIIEDDNGSSVEKGDNTKYKKEFEKGKATGLPETNGNHKIIFTLNPKTEYIIKWYNTETGKENGLTQTVKSNSSGKVKFDVPEITKETNQYGGFGYKIVIFSR